jgi:hypothetical protein
VHSLPFHETVFKMMIVVSRAIHMTDLELVGIDLGFEEGGASRSPWPGWAPIDAGAVKSVTKYNGIVVQ